MKKTIYCKREDIELLKRLSKKLKVSESEVIRKALRLLYKTIEERKAHLLI